MQIHPLGIAELIFVEFFLPLHVVLAHAPNMASNVDLLASLLQVVEISWQLAQIQTLLVHLNDSTSTLMPIY